MKYKFITLVLSIINVTKLVTINKNNSKIITKYNKKFIKKLLLVRKVNRDFIIKIETEIKERLTSVLF